MKKQFTLLTFSILFAVGKISAQNFTPIAATGYTLDAVAENTTAVATTGGAIDGSDYILYSAAYGALFGSTYGLPNNGLLTTGTRTYQLQPYTAVNMLYIPTLHTDSLTFTTPSPYLGLSLAGFATEGAITSQMNVTVRFTDNTTQVFSGLSIADWFAGTTSVVASGFDRAGRTSGAVGNSGSSGWPKMFYTDLSILCANQGKSVKRIIVQNAASNPRICIMAVSGTLPAYSVTASTLITCGASNVTLTAAGMTSYTWQPVGSFAGSNSTSIVVTPTTTTSYTLNGTVASGCPGSSVVTIFASTGTPTLTFTGSTPTVCLGSAATITASGAITYTLSNSVANGGTFTPASTANYTVSGANGCGTSSAVTSITVTPLPVTAIASNTLVCSGTPATLTAGGATSYTWVPGANTSTNFIVSPAANTIYTLTGVIAGNCTGSTTVAVTTKPNPILTIAASNTAICNGGSASLNITGNAVSYTWNPTGQLGTAITVTPTQVTLYTATGTGTGNCTSSASQVIIVYANPTITAVPSDALVCSGGSSTLAASGASTYVWSNNATTSTTVVNPITDETFTVSGTSSVGCSGSTVVTVAVYAPSITVSSNTFICSGSGVTVGADVADSWTWSNGSTLQNITINPTLTTVYTVTASVNNLNGLSCDATNSVQVTVNPNPTITAVSNPTAICIGQTAILTGSGAGAGGTYVWTGGAGAIQSATTSVSPIATQNYTITGTDANGCKGSGTYQLKVGVCQGIAVNSADAANLLIYPNPSNGNFTISSDQVITLQITNELGQQVKTVTLNGTDAEVNVSNLAGGVYFITGKNENGSVKQKIVISK
jgi:hypothetical protein